MSHCLLYFPGLFGPDIPLQELPDSEWPAAKTFTYLQDLLSRATIERLPGSRLESQLFQLCGAMLETTDDAPVADIRCRLNAGYPDQSVPVYCLDPVFLRVDQDQAIFTASEERDIREDDARHLIDDLNTHFSADGLQVHYFRPHQWLLEAPLELTTASLYETQYKNVEQHQPSGADARCWRRYLNEMQMLLHGHEVNQARELRGELPVNSLWLWGRARPYQYEPVIETLYSHDQRVLDLARALDIQCIQTQSTPQPVSLGQTQLWVELGQMDAIWRKDAYSWFDWLAQLEQHFLSPIMQQLEQGKLESFTLVTEHVSLTLEARAARPGWWNRWRRSPSFRQQILALRNDNNR